MPKAKDTEYRDRTATAERTEHRRRRTAPPRRRRRSSPTRRRNTGPVPGGEPGQQLPGSQPAHGEIRRRAARHQRAGSPELRPPEEPGGVRPEGKAGDAGGGDGSLQRGQLREFPRLPLYRDFHRWPIPAQRLLDLHIGFETAETYPLERYDRENIDPTRAILRADKERGTITLDERTTLAGVPAQPVQGEETPGPDHPGEVQQLPLFQPQGAGHRPAASGLHRQRGDHGDSGQHGPPGAGGTARASPWTRGLKLRPQCRRMKAQKDRTKCCGTHRQWTCLSCRWMPIDRTLGFTFCS